MCYDSDLQKKTLEFHSDLYESSLPGSRFTIINRSDKKPFLTRISPLLVDSRLESELQVSLVFVSFLCDWVYSHRTCPLVWGSCCGTGPSRSFLQPCPVWSPSLRFLLYYYAWKHEVSTVPCSSQRDVKSLRSAQRSILKGFTLAHLVTFGGLYCFSGWDTALPSLA